MQTRQVRCQPWGSMRGGGARSVQAAGDADDWLGGEPALSEEMTRAGGAFARVGKLAVPQDASEEAGADNLGSQDKLEDCEGNSSKHQLLEEVELIEKEVVNAREELLVPEETPASLLNDPCTVEAIISALPLLRTAARHWCMLFHNVVLAVHSGVLRRVAPRAELQYLTLGIDTLRMIEAIGIRLRMAPRQSSEGETEVSGSSQVHLQLLGRERANMRTLCALLPQDRLPDALRQALRDMCVAADTTIGLPPDFQLPVLGNTAQSAALQDEAGFAYSRDQNFMLEKATKASASAVQEEEERLAERHQQRSGKEDSGWRMNNDMLLGSSAGALGRVEATSRQTAEVLSLGDGFTFDLGGLEEEGNFTNAPATGDRAGDRDGDGMSAHLQHVRMPDDEERKERTFKKVNAQAKRKMKKMLGKASNLQDFKLGAKGANTADEDELEVAEVMASIKGFNPAKLTASIKQSDLNQVYSQASRRKAKAVVVDKAVEMKVDTRNKPAVWTYQLLAESKPLRSITRALLQRFRKHFENYYRSNTSTQRFEILCLVDNSGSMGMMQNQLKETLVVLMETLRRMEFRFAIARFGSRRKAKQMLKGMNQPMSYSLGEQILESFSFDEGTYPATAFESVCRHVWGTDSGHREQKRDEEVHRLTIMLTDGLTEENRAEEYESVMKDHDVKLSILYIHHIAGELEKTALAMVHALKGRITVKDVETPDMLCVALGQLLEKEFLSIIGATSSNNAKTTQRPRQIVSAPKFIDLYKWFLPLADLTAMSLHEAKQQGGNRLEAMFKVSDPHASIPYITPGLQVGAEDQGLRRRAQQSSHSSRKALADLHSQTMRASGEIVKNVVSRAREAWNTACVKLTNEIDDYVSAFEDVVFPFNKFTRRKADVRGSTLYLPGLIKAVSTDWHYKKYMSTKSSGGKRQYTVAIALDVSFSMNGHLANCAVQTLLCMVCALERIGLDNFSLLVFGQEVRLVKTDAEEWGPVSILTLLSQLKFEDNASFDAHGVNCALDLLEISASRGPKRLFVLSDGYGTSGIELSRALQRAENEGVEVIGVGVGFDTVFVPQCYQKWVTAALPSAVPQALRALFSGENQMGDEDEAEWDSKYNVLLQGGANTTEEVFLQHSKIFDGLLQKLGQERAGKLQEGSAPGAVTVDVCFCLDTTGSMLPFIKTIKAQIVAITGGIGPKVAKQYPGITLVFRWAVVAYKDVNDSPQFSTFSFSDDQAAACSFIRGLVASGGGDVPEDVLGALNHAASQLEWKSKAKYLLLIGDAPGHGRDLTSDPRDAYPNGVGGLKVRHLMEKLGVELGIDLMFCEVRPNSTRKMLNEFKKYYNNPSAYDSHPEQPLPKTLQVQTLFQADQTGGNHFVFVLDESGSMGGGKWEGLCRAYQRFLLERKTDQGNDDKVSVIQFASSERLVISCQDLDSASTSLSMNSGGTSFNPALHRAKTELGKCPSLAPVLIFMTDGQSGDNADGVMKEIATDFNHRDFRCHVIAFGSDADTSTCQRLASIAGGKFHLSKESVDLENTFATVAKGSGLVDQMAQGLGDKIAEMVSRQLILDYL